MIFKEWFKKRNLNEAGYGPSIELDPKIQKAICILRPSEPEFNFDLSSIPAEYSPSPGNLVLTGEQLILLFNQLVKKWQSIGKGQGDRIHLLDDRSEAAKHIGYFLKKAVEKSEDFAQQQFTIKCPN